MATIRVAIPNDLLLALDKAAKDAGTNRSAIVREGLQTHLRRLETLDKEKRDREGYIRFPQTEEDFVWDSEVAWPEEDELTEIASS